MKIVSARVIVCSPGRNFVTLKIETDAGIYGLGDATLNGRELAVVEYLEQYCIPALIGRDPRNIEDIWHYFYRGVYWKRGPITMTALAAIDVALWDLKAKSLNTPLYNLLGGRSRQSALVYVHATGRDIAETIDNIEKHIDAGYTAIRVQCAVPGVSDGYGVATSGFAYEPAKKGVAKEEQWDNPKYLRFAPRLFDAVRQRFGEDIHLLHDVHHRCTPIEAARLAKDLEPYRLFWLEDAVTGELQEGLRLVRKHSVTPLAIGEVFNSVYDYTTLFTEQLVDYVRMPLVHGGGITHLQKVAAFAGIYHILTGFHGPTDVSPISVATALHFDLAINNFGIQEYMPHAEVVSEVFRTNYRCQGGTMSVDDTPGHGVDIDEVAAGRFPYEMACLPVARKVDGTLHYW
jgi:mannonate dehydratase